MTSISTNKLAETLNDGAEARLPSTIQRWPGRNAGENLPGLLLDWVVTGAAFAIRQLPGMAMFSPLILSMVVEIAFHTIVGTAAWAKQGVTFSLRRLVGIAKGWIVAVTTFLSDALAARGLTTATGKRMATGFRPALLGALAFLFMGVSGPP